MKKLALLLLFIPAAAFAESKVVRFSMGGNIRVDRAPHGAVLRTMGGDIRLKHAGGKVVTKTMGGNIRVDGVEDSIDAGTMGGDVDVEVVGGGSGRKIDVSSMGGEIEVTLPKDFPAEFEIELERDKDDGDRHRIVSDFPLQIQESTRRRWFRKVTVVTASGKNGSGANRVRITTIGGNITIRRR